MKLGRNLLGRLCPATFKVWFACVICTYFCSVAAVSVVACRTTAILMGYFSSCWERQTNWFCRRLTSIQEEAVPAILGGGDVFLVSRRTLIVGHKLRWSKRKLCRYDDKFAIGTVYQGKKPLHCKLCRPAAPICIRAWLTTVELHN